MNKKGISQETLKLIACVTMFIDHAGAILVYSWYLSDYFTGGMHAMQLWTLYIVMRIVGRIAFPIYCLLLVEGAHYTRNPGKYALRLAIGVLLSEIPFDLALYGHFSWETNNVMVTLLLGFGMLMTMKKVTGLWKILLIIPWALAADLLKTDYAAHGILIIAFLALTKDLPHEKLIRALGMVVLLWFGGSIAIGSMMVPLEIFGLFSLIPIFCYSGKKQSHNKALQWAFYLFYPAHLLLLWFLNAQLFG